MSKEEQEWLPASLAINSLYLLQLPILSFFSCSMPHAISIMNLFGGISFNPDEDIPDLSGKVVFVTGGEDKNTANLSVANLSNLFIVQEILA